MPDRPAAEPFTVILYDGVCGLCNRWVQFILKRDRRRVFRFAALQSSIAREILARHAISPNPADTVYAVQELGRSTERVFSKSSASLFILSQLGGVWGLASIARFLPAKVGDFMYGALAKRRYRMFGQYESCLLPDEVYRERFIDRKAM